MQISIEEIRSYCEAQLPMEQDPALKAALIDAFLQLYQNDHYLIFHDEEPHHRKSSRGKHASEKAIVFRFSHYLQNALEGCPDYPEAVVDCEYNRMGIRSRDLKRSGVISHPICCSTSAVRTNTIC